MVIEYNAIVAVGPNNIIGVANAIPWSCKEEMKLFSSITKTSNRGLHCVIMGRKTFESMNSVPLADRINIIVSKTAKVHPDWKKFENPNEHQHVFLVESLSDALDCAYENQCAAGFEKIEIGPSIFVIGGEQLYREAIQHGPIQGKWERYECTTVYMSKMSETICIDSLSMGPKKYFCGLDASEWKLDSVKAKTNDFWMGVYKKISPKIESEEYGYIDLVKTILRSGTLKTDRTGTGTLSIFGPHLKFTRVGEPGRFPLLTTKKVFWKGVREELLWFISGCTDANVLKAQGVSIWDGNGSREFLDSRGLFENKVGNLGPVYGAQWRNSGGTMNPDTCMPNFDGVDQLAQVIHTIKTNPDDRRMIVCAWNPSALDKMALPPCHLLFQFYCVNNILSVQVYQRSVDVGLGLPFNIASYSLLLCMMAQVTGKMVGDVLFCLGDTHIYSNHVKALQTQIQNDPMPFPTLQLNPMIIDITEFTSSDIVIKDYKCHESIAMKMAV